MNESNQQPQVEAVITPPPVTCCAAAPKWEYLIGGMEYCLPFEEQKKLNELGAQGWELVACIRLPHETRFYMKRVSGIAI